MQKVLIITYYWPPSGGSAVLRWLKFTKYLREFGWEPVIYTPANPEPQETDESLQIDVPENLEVLRTRICEPYGLYKWLAGKKQGEKLGVALMSDKKKPGRFSRLSLWIRSNLFIPDPRIFWIKPSIRFISKYLEQHPADVIISTGPPHSMHLIGLGLKRKLGIRWVADFRDPWTNIDFFQDLSLTILARRYHQKLERSVLQEADHIITVSPGMSHDFKIMGIKSVSTITNGYDEEPLILDKQNDDKFSLLHLGSMPKSRNPLNLWQILSDLVRENERFSSRLEIRLVGKVDFSVTESIVQHGLQNHVVQQEYVPHDQTFSWLSQASVLLLSINNTPNAKGILTNKFFEYLSTQRPILAIGPADGDVSAILAETGAGRIFEYDDLEGLKSHILTLFELYSQQSLTTNRRDITKYSRKNLTREVSELLNSLVS
jgi:glycosyltransferase involved in cell wall biosynthesis